MKKKKNPFLRILNLLFFIFLSLYIALESGYYSSYIEEKGVIVQENLEKFEQDVQNGALIDKESYIKEETKIYNNKISDTGVFLGEKVEEFMSGGMLKFLGALGSLFS